LRPSFGSPPECPWIDRSLGGKLGFDPWEKYLHRLHPAFLDKLLGNASFEKEYEKENFTGLMWKSFF